MSISIQSVLENHEVRLRDLEGRPVPSTHKTLIQEHKLQHTQTVSETQQNNTNYNTIINNINNVVDSNKVRMEKLEDTNNKLMEKYNSLLELHKLLTLDLLRFKTSIEEKERIKLEIVETDTGTDTQHETETEESQTRQEGEERQQPEGEQQGTDTHQEPERHETEKIKTAPEGGGNTQQQHNKKKNKRNKNKKR